VSMQVPEQGCTPRPPQRGGVGVGSDEDVVFVGRRDEVVGDGSVKVVFRKDVEDKSEVVEFKNGGVVIGMVADVEERPDVVLRGDVVEEISEVVLELAVVDETTEVVLRVEEGWVRVDVLLKLAVVFAYGGVGVGRVREFVDEDTLDTGMDGLYVG